MTEKEIAVGCLVELDDPGCRECRIGDCGRPLKGFIVRMGSDVYAYPNYRMHLGHPLNRKPHGFLTRDGTNIIRSSHRAIYDITSAD